MILIPIHVICLLYMNSKQSGVKNVKLPDLMGSNGGQKPDYSPFYGLPVEQTLSHITHVFHSNNYPVIELVLEEDRV
jgi:hypothetical protein